MQKEDKTKKATNVNVQTFNLKEGVTLTMSAGEVDKDFCDASSPVSLAGYMSGEYIVFLICLHVVVIDMHICIIYV